MRIGSAKPPSSWPLANVLRQLSTPTRRVVLGGDVAAVHDQPLRADRGRGAACWASILRLGIRILLLVLATLTRYGEWM